MTLLDALPAILVLIGLALLGLGMLAVGLPGVWVSALGVWAMGAWPGLSLGFKPWSLTALAWLLGVALLAELLEWLMMWVAGRRLRLSRGATAAAMLGGLAGAFMGMVAGPVWAVLSSWLGLVVFAVFWLVAFEVKTIEEALKGGLKALAARLTGLAIKAAMQLGLVIWAFYSLIKHLPAKPLG